MALSMPFPVLINKLGARAHVGYFSFDVASPAIRVTDLDRKGNAKAPKIKKCKLLWETNLQFVIL